MSTGAPPTCSARTAATHSFCRRPRLPSRTLCSECRREPALQVWRPIPRLGGKLKRVCRDCTIALDAQGTLEVPDQPPARALRALSIPASTHDGPPPADLADVAEDQGHPLAQRQPQWPNLNRDGFEKLAADVAEECERLVALVDEELDRVQAAAGKPYQEGLAQGAERKLLEIQRRFFTAQAVLIDPSDSRYAAVQRILGDLPGNLTEPGARAA